MKNTIILSLFTLFILFATKTNAQFPVAVNEGGVPVGKKLKTKTEGKVEADTISLEEAKNIFFY